MPENLEPGDVFAVAAELAGALARAGIEYAIGGALAFALWGEARGTRDVDIALYQDRSREKELFNFFEELGGELERDVCRWRLDNSGYFEFVLKGVRIDVFLADCKLYDLAKPRRVQAILGTTPTWFWAAEDLILFKLLFFRDKDKVDIQSIIGVRGDELDLNYLRATLADIFRDEERSSWFEHAVKSNLP